MNVLLAVNRGTGLEQCRAITAGEANQGKDTARQRGKTPPSADAASSAGALGERLRQRLEQLDLTGAAVARRLQIDSQKFSNYMTGRHRPSYEMLVRICLVLETTPGQLLGLEEMPAPPGKDSPREAWIADISRYLRLLSDQELRIAVRAIKMMHRTLRDLE